MKRIAIILLYFGFTTILHSQEDAVIDSAVNNIAKQLLVFPQEKIYLQTDKPYYITGEKIFFRAFLLDAFSNRQDTLSRYVYVELINPADSVAQRVKIRRDSTYMFYGAIPLREDLPQGNYRIRAYTQYMQNQGESAFFSKQVKISDPQILSIQPQTDFQFSEAGTINTSLRFVDAKTQAVIHPQSITMRLNQDQSVTRNPDKDGWVRIKLTVPQNASTRVLYVELTDNSNVFKQYIPIPYPDGDFDVSFYPEGGNLIAGQSSNVAFKALDSGGAALNIKGEVVDSKGNTVAELKTGHDGMGDFFINPLPDEHYRAVVPAKGERQKAKEISLPEVQTNAVALKALIRDNKLWVSINKYDSASFTDLYLLIHSRGSIVYAKAWDSSKDFVILDKSIFPSGVSHIILLTKDFRIVSERLIFILNDDNGTATFQTNKDSYHKREQVISEIQLIDEKQNPLVAGNFSISVTNDKEVVPDTTSSILSGILLCSELKGHIDNPDYYFQKGNKEAEQAADLLMRTHGWARYAIPDVIRGKLNYPKIPFEQSQEFTGMVKSGLVLKNAKNFKVSLLALNQRFFDLAETDKNGRFLFHNFEFPDSTSYMIQALNKRGGAGEITNLYVDEDTFPKIYLPWIYPIVKEEKAESVFLDYIAKADRQYTYEHGMRIIQLPEVQVSGRRKDVPDIYGNIYLGAANYDMYSYSAGDLKRLKIPNLIRVINHVPFLDINKITAILIDNELIFPRRELLVPNRIKSQMEEETENSPEGQYRQLVNNLGMVNIEDIENLYVYMGKGLFSIGNIIYISTKKGPRSTDNIKPITPLGYQLPIEFYSPKYDTKESINSTIPDLRTTIYWKPNVLTDKTGNAKLDFSTADDPGTYSVVIEGVSEDGKLIHYQGRSAMKTE